MVSTLAQAQQSDPYQSWARVLARFVSDRGDVDFRALSRERGDLDVFLDHVARISPRSAPEMFPGREAKLAYYTNAYNALAMFDVIDSGFAETLSCMVVSCPRMPRMAFTPEKLNRQLEEEARRFFSETRNLRIVPDRRFARVSSLLKFYAEDFRVKSATLIAYINLYASASIPADFEIEFMEYDWTVNDQNCGVARHELR